MKKNNLFTALCLLLCLVTALNAQGTYEIRKLSVNTEYSDFGVSFSGEDEVIFSSADRKDTQIKQRKTQPFLNLYKGVITLKGNIINVEEFSDNINSNYHEANAVFTKDGSMVYFSGNNYARNTPKNSSAGANLVQLYRAQVSEEGHWTDIEKLPFNDDNFQTGHPALNHDDSKLFFISDRPDSLGKTDIYVVDINEDGTFGEPVNLGVDVNTEEREMFPFYDSKNKSLYFSSDGHQDNYGGLDMYVVELNAYIPASAPVNLGYPMNTYWDDFSIVMRPGRNWGYFASDRYNKGNDDIYWFRKLNNIVQDSGCLTTITGKVRDDVSNSLLPGSTITLYNRSTNQKIESIITDSFGRYSINVENCDTEETGFIISSSKPGYKENLQNISLKLNDRNEVNFILNSVEEKEDTRVTYFEIDPIYFDFGKAEIREDAAIGLEKVIKIMRSYPELKISVESHTDSRSEPNINETLSKARMKNTLAWLIERGIDANRLSSVSHGESQILNKCTSGVKCSESEHQVNRRVEFVIKNPQILD